MKSQKGITLIALVIYVIVATIVIGTMATLSAFFFSNANNIKGQEEYAVEYNKFNMFFVNDVKNNQTAEITNGDVKKIKFADETTYEWRDGSIYRNDKKIATNVNSVEISSRVVKRGGETTQKTVITVEMDIGVRNSLKKSIEYVLKYW